MTTLPKQNYRVTETLHASEWTLVYRGLRRSDHRPVVLKVLGPRHVLPMDVERLEHELQIAGPLGGKGALKPLGLDHFQGLPALVLEDFDGQPLRTLLRGPMEPGRFLRLASPIAAALSSVHRSNVIHKDLNPGSILVNEKTGQVRLTEFGRASVLPRENEAPRSAALLEGTLAYISPEQTGRMNRTIDHRTDLYSLGVMFFEMLTGRLPHVANDALEWVHCHVARPAPSPDAIVPGLPVMLSRLVLKLLAKGAEHRYQSAAGLEHDLERCRLAWEATGAIAPFDLGQRDWSERLSLPQKLYGRGADAARLVQAFNRVAASGTSEVVLVSGYAGIGKSSLVHELHRPVVREGGLFLAGKFDQHSRDIPYAVLVKAFRELILDILTESDARIAAWRQRLQQALGANGRLIVDLIPQLALIIGPQPPVPELRPSEAQRRFAVVVRRFIAAFPAADRPVVLFLDDLQWADRASLGLLEELARDPDTRSLLVVGAYRDNEVDPAHPLTRSLAQLRQGGAPVHHIVLGPLSLQDLRALVSDMLRCDQERATELASLVLDRTAGNPFFALHFLSVLYQDGLIERDPGTHAWRWDVARIAARGTTSNVVEFILERLKLLTRDAQELLELAACMGGISDLPLLAEVSGRAPAHVERCLRDAAREGLLLRFGDGFRFAHDRVQQAAYLLMPEGARPATHLRIGRLLLARTPADAREGAVFEIVTQLNLGSDLLHDPAERLELARLNLVAGRRAKASNAHAAAIAYLSTGLRLLGPESWQTHHDLTYELELALAESSLLSGDIDGSLRRSAGIVARAATARAKVPGYLLARDAHLAQGHAANAVANELAALALFGIELPSQPTSAQMASARARVDRLLAGRPIEVIAALPLTADPDLEAALRMTSAASFTDKDLYFMMAATMVAVSLERGNAEGSVFWYGCYGFILSGLGEFQDGQRFAQAALALQEKHGFAASRGQAHFFLSLTSFWAEPLSTFMAETRATLDVWSEAGPLSGAALATFNEVNGTMTAGVPLDKVSQGLVAARAFLRKIGFRDTEEMCLLLLQFVRALQGQTVSLESLTDADFDQERFGAALSNTRLPRLVCWYWMLRMRAELLAGNYRRALEAGEKAMPLAWSVAGNLPSRDLVLYRALSIAALFEDGSADERERWLLELTEHERKLEAWAEANPSTFQHHHALVSAEIARLTGHQLEAAELYRQSIRAATDGGFLQDEALAYELGARLREAQGLPAMADLYRREARARYLRWGAVGKVRQLDARYPHLAADSSGPPAGLPTSPERIDLLSVIKASQAISREVVASKLLRTLMEVVLAQSGAVRGALITPRDGALFVEVEATITGSQTEITIPKGGRMAASTLLPESILRFAWRTGEGLVLDDATKEPRFADDAYILQNRPQSVLCLPIVQKGELMALLYLENNVVSAAFTPDRLTVLGVLAGQAAISLENSLLFQRLTDEIADRTRAEEMVRFLADAGEALAESLDFQATLAKVTRLAVPFLADWCVVDVVDSSGEVRRVAEAHRDPARERSLKQLRARLGSLGSPRHAIEAMEKGAPVLLADLTDAVLGRYLDDPESLRQLKELGAHSAMILPLLAGGRRLGAMSFVSGSAERRYSTSDLAVAEELARRAAVAIDNARLYAEAAEAIRLRDEFLSIASHELNTPLTSLRLMSDGLNTAPLGKSPQMLTKMGPMMTRQITRLTKLVDELLNVTRIHGGQLQLQLEAVDLASVVREVADWAGDEVARAHCAVTIDGGSPVVGLWDRGRLEQIVTNLLSNAVKFGAGNPIELSVVELADGSVRLAVADHGIGIPSEKLRHIFGRFSRAVSASNYGGLGLGLYIVSELVRALGGAISVESTVGEGSRFTVTLPRSAARSADEGTDQSDVAVVEAGAPGGRQRSAKIHH